MAYPDNPEVAFSYSFQIYGWQPKADAYQVKLISPLEKVKIKT
jgi:hypothetical protein